MPQEFNLQEALKLAIQTEKNVMDFYKEAAGVTRNPQGKKVFELLAGEVDIAPIPSIEWARNASKLMLLPRLCVSSEGAVDSIQLVTRKPLEQVRVVAVTPESATSVALTKVLLPDAIQAPLESYDSGEAEAKLLIGDAALRSAFEDPTPHYDLGRLWLERTGLPMVFAVWACPEPLADGLAAAGPDVVVVPLLLSTGFHLTADIGQATAAVATGAGTHGRTATAAAPRVTGPLGPDPLLSTALAARLTETGVPAGTPVVLAAAGSSDPVAAAQVRSQADLLAGELGAEVVAAFAAAGQPTVQEAVADLRARTGGPVAVATYLLAPGRLHAGPAGSGADWVSAPLGDHPAVAALVLDPYRAHRSAA